MWYAEKQYMDKHGNRGEWGRIGSGPWRTQERAKGECRQDLRGQLHNAHRIAYRLVRDDPRGTVDAESRPPHGTRMSWAIT